MSKKTYKAIKTSRFHDREITDGTYGELSKIQEELDEARDAEERGIDLLVLIELADVIGACAGVAEEKYGFSLDGLIQFSEMVRDVKYQEALEEENATADEAAQEVEFKTKLIFAIRDKFREDPNKGRKAAKRAKERYDVNVKLDDLEAELLEDTMKVIAEEEPEGLKGQLVEEDGTVNELIDKEEGGDGDGE